MFHMMHICRHELGLWFRDGDLAGVLRPGHHRVPGWFNWFHRDTVQVIDRMRTAFEHPKLDILVLEDALEDEIEVVDLKDDERALVWKDGRLGWFLGPGRHAFWKEPHEIAVERVQVSDLRVRHERLEAIVAHPAAEYWIEIVEVPVGEEGLLFVNGQLVEELEPGKHAFWKGAGTIRSVVIDRREKSLDANAQDIMTADKVTLRVNLLVTFRIVDAVRSVTVVSDSYQTLYREAQLALRAAVGARTLDKVLSDKDALGDEVRDAIVERAREYGGRV